MQPVTEWRLETSSLGRRVLVYSEVESTNTLAAAFASDLENDGLVLLADHQTAGRGQHGRTWSSEPGSAVLLSVLLFPPPALRRPVILAAMAAVAVCETIWKTTGMQPSIKWPNDVLIKGRKVCGILIEQSLGTVIGLGLNVNQPEEWFVQSGLPTACSLYGLTGFRLDREQVARTVIRALDNEYAGLLHGDLYGLERRWQELLAVMHLPVTLECPDATVSGVCRQLNFDGVQLRSKDGKMLSYSPEKIKHIQLA